MARRDAHLIHDDWDRPQCSICTAGRNGKIDLLRIEKLLSERAELRAIAKQFDLSHHSLRRHWLGVSTERKNYLETGRQLVKDALAAELAEEKVSTIDHLRIVRGGLHRSFAHAVEVNDHRGAASLAAVLEKNIMDGARLAGEWQPAGPVQNNVTILNLPGVAATIAGIARVLAPYPEARAAVVEYLRQVRPQPPAPAKIEARPDATD
jgi:hypothetical protein